MADGEAQVSMVLYISDGSAACERALANVRAVAQRLELAPSAYRVRNVSREPLAVDERRYVVLTPLLVTVEGSPRRIAGELDDAESLDLVLRRVLRRAERA
jgi:hypothetical protein